MKSYTQVYNTSRAEVQEKRRQVYENHKIAIVNLLKEEYGIEGKMSEQPASVKEMMAKKLAEFWSPKTGINNAGVRLLNEKRIILTPASSVEDVKRYIQRMAKRNINNVTECFRRNHTEVFVDQFNEDIKSMMGKTVKSKFIIESVWEVVSERIKLGL